jgi:hypothetical protein
MRLPLAVPVLAALLGGCAVYPDGTLGPLPPVPTAGYYAPPPVAYAPPIYATGEGVPVYVAPPPPVVVSPSIGLGFYWGPRGWWGPGYYGRPHYRGRRW